MKPVVLFLLFLLGISFSSCDLFFSEELLSSEPQEDYYNNEDDSDSIKLNSVLKEYSKETAVKDDTASSLDPSSLHPVVLLPGLAVSNIYAKLNRTSKKHWWCRLQSDWYQIWLTPGELLPGAVDCFKDNFRREVDKETGFTRNVNGVETNVPDFGNTTFDYLFFKLKLATYYAPLVDSLVEIGYKRGLSVRGAPFDLRMSPYEMEEYFQSLKELIEKIYQENNNKRTVIIGHSAGAAYSLFFLRKMTKEWKDKYIKSLITLGAPFGGAIQGLTAVTLGSAEGINVFKDDVLKELVRTFSSMTFYLPDERVFGDQVILSIKSKNDWKNLTAKEMPSVFRLFNYTEEIMWRRSRESIRDNHYYDKDPGVDDVTCFVGTGLKTPQEISFNNGFSEKPKIVYGPGDGTVNSVCNQVCKNWMNKRSKGTSLYKEFEKVGHIDLVRNKEVVKSIVERIQDFNKNDNLN